MAVWAAAWMVAAGLEAAETEEVVLAAVLMGVAVLALARRVKREVGVVGNAVRTQAGQGMEGARLAMEAVVRAWVPRATVTSARAEEATAAVAVEVEVMVEVEQDSAARVARPTLVVPVVVLLAGMEGPAVVCGGLAAVEVVGMVVEAMVEVAREEGATAAAALVEATLAWVQMEVLWVVEVVREAQALAGLEMVAVEEVSEGVVASVASHMQVLVSRAEVEMVVVVLVVVEMGVAATAVARVEAVGLVGVYRVGGAAAEAAIAVQAREG